MRRLKRDEEAYWRRKCKGEDNGSVKEKTSELAVELVLRYQHVS